MPATDTAHPRIGLALGGGGARGLAHIGILKVLERERIPIECLAGTSMGGLLAALYTTGMSAADLEAEMLRHARRGEIRRVLEWLPLPFARGPGERVRGYLNAAISAERTFADLRYPLALTAVDLESGQEVVLREGGLVDAICATIAVPGVYVPIVSGDRRLIDGGVLNNVPADVVRELGSEAVIAVDVLPAAGTDPSGRPRAPSLSPGRVPAFARDLVAAGLIAMAALTEARLRRARPDVLLRPALPPDVTLFSGFARAAELIAVGEETAEAAMPSIRALLQRGASA